MPITKSTTVSFTTKGQLVIPNWLRKEFHIQEGTKAVVTGTSEGILLQPITASAIRRARGLLSPKREGKSFAEDWAAHKKEEKALEETKLARHRS